MQPNVTVVEDDLAGCENEAKYNGFINEVDSQPEPQGV
jgi:hypothetical protein